MNQKQINNINKEVYRRFPEVSGKKPQVKKRQHAETRSIKKSTTYSLTYRYEAKTATNKLIPYYVRVTANEDGKILKIAMSH